MTNRESKASVSRNSKAAANQRFGKNCISCIPSHSTVSIQAKPANDQPTAVTLQREPEEEGSIWNTLTGPLVSGGGFLLDQAVHHAGDWGGPLVPGAGGIFGGLYGMYEGAEEGGLLGGLKMGGGGLELAGGLGEAALAGGAAEAGLAGTLAEAGPVGMAFGGGLAAGDVLYNHTSVGPHAVDSLGGLDAMLTGEGERSWALRTSEAMSEDWDQGNYLSSIGNGAELGLFATAGALAGLGGGIVDGVSAIGGGISDAASAVWDWL